MIRHAMIVGLVVIFCCGALAAQEAAAVPPRVTAPVRAEALARAAQRTNAGLSGTVTPAAAAQQQADADAGDEVSTESADGSGEAGTSDDEQPTRKQKKRGNRGPGTAQRIGETALVAVIAAVVTIAAIAVALGS